MSENAAINVEVIVPIFNAITHVRRCLDSLIGRLPSSATLQLVNDASTDPSVQELLSSHPVIHHARTRVHHNRVNLGFTETVNKAAERAEGDFVLLNSDTRVSDGWLERLHRCAQSNTRVASVTPWSNNAEICSFPNFCENQAPPAAPDALAKALANSCQPAYPNLPTAVGFCMYVRRAAWQKVGDFDLATFGRGYGEENDWCMRATAHGYGHLLCDDAYVIHDGGASFADTNHRPGGEQLQRLLARYPYYNALIASFIQGDPLDKYRRALLADPSVAAALAR